MPFRITNLVDNFYYHVFNRGVNKRNIFTNKRDYSKFQLLTKFYNSIDYPIRFSKFMLLSSDQRQEIWHRLDISKKHTDILAYCLMPNHFHFLLKQNTKNGISKFMANLQNSYAKYFNIKNNRVGPLFQGQFKAVKIDSEEQLLHVSRYIHLNPYSSGIIGDIHKLIQYPYSSLSEYLNLSRFNMCNKNDILASFKKREAYINFVLDNADYQKNIEDIKHLTLE